MLVLKLLVLGAGGIGGYYAARLADAGHQIVLTDQGEHLLALKTRGLTLDYEGQVLQHFLPACSHQELIRDFNPDDFDLIVIALKSTVTQTVVAELTDWLKSGSVPALSLQNGVDNEQLIANVIGEERVLGGLAVRIGGHLTEPGKVFAEGVGQILMGAWPTQLPDDSRAPLLKKLQATFNEAGIPTTVTNNIRYKLWRELVINNGVYPLSALTGMDTRSLTHHSDYKDIVYQMMAETVAASRADEVNVTDQDLQDLFEQISNSNALKTSMLVDKEKGRPLELDGISGAVLKRCEKLGVAAPYTARVLELLSRQ